MPLEQRTTDNSDLGLEKNSHAKGTGESDSKHRSASKSKAESRDSGSHQDHSTDENLAELKNRITVLHRKLVRLESELAQCQDEQHEAFNDYVALAHNTRKVTAPVVLCVMVLMFSISTAILVRNALKISRALAPGFFRGVGAVFSGPYPLTLKIAFAMALPLLIGVICLGLYITLSGRNYKRAHTAAIDTLMKKYEACHEVQAKIAHGRLALQAAVVSVADASMKQLQFVQQGILMCVGELDDMQKFRLRLDNEISAINRRIPGLVEEIRKHTDDALEWNLARTKSILESTEERLRDMGNELVRYLDDARALIEDARIAAGSMQHLVDGAVKAHLAEVLKKVSEVSDGFLALQKSVSDYLEKSSGLVAREVMAILDDRMRSLRTMYNIWNVDKNSVVNVCCLLKRALKEAEDISTTISSYKNIENSLKYETHNTKGEKKSYYVHKKIDDMAKKIKAVLSTVQKIVEKEQGYTKDEIVKCRDVLRQLDRALFGEKAVFADEAEYTAFIRAASKATEQSSDSTPLPEQLQKVKRFIEENDGFFVYLPYLMTSAMVIDHMKNSVEQMTDVCSRLASIAEDVRVDVRSSSATPGSNVDGATVFMQGIPFPWATGGCSDQDTHGSSAPPGSSVGGAVLMPGTASHTTWTTSVRPQKVTHSPQL
ncbi:hypothetical protein AOV_04415 [Anaplasma ovis str. Haibei]|nr:hypothetical protein [Anaplasma ovis]AWZ18670.1 hypothetical protein AOV_04415 [Anaplasma ovis str. Haibei]